MPMALRVVVRRVEEDTTRAKNAQVQRQACNEEARRPGGLALVLL